jgi:hypothetical protein
VQCSTAEECSCRQLSHSQLSYSPHVLLPLGPCQLLAFTDSAWPQAAAALGVNVSSSGVRGYALTENVSPAAKLSTVMLRGDVGLKRDSTLVEASTGSSK